MEVLSRQLTSYFPISLQRRPRVARVIIGCFVSISKLETAICSRCKKGQDTGFLSLGVAAIRSAPLVSEWNFRFQRCIFRNIAGRTDVDFVLLQQIGLCISWWNRLQWPYWNFCSWHLHAIGLTFIVLGRLVYCVLQKYRKQFAKIC